MKIYCMFEVPKNILWKAKLALHFLQKPRTHWYPIRWLSMDYVQMLVGPCGVFAFTKFQNKMSQLTTQAIFNPGIEKATRKFTQQRDLVKTAERIIFLKRNFISSPSYQFLSPQEQVDFVNDIHQTAQFLINLFAANPVLAERSTLS